MISNLMNIGQTGLNAAQAWISVTGNNLANADTEGYSRQYVDQKDAGGLKYRPGAQPLGVNAQQVMRFFDAFLESAYVRQSSTSTRWDQQDTIMATVENLFNEANRQGLHSAMSNFFNAWSDLTLRPNDTAVRESLVSYADNLSDMFKQTVGGLKAIQQEMDVSIAKDVARVNEIANAIADLNRQITASTIDGINNPNSLLDKRDQLVREMATLVDVETIDHGKGNFRVQLTTGQPLVEGVQTYSLAVLGPQKNTQLQPGSRYQGEVNFVGNDSHEYTVEIVRGGDAGGTGDVNPQFRVSLDGGRTWLRAEDGQELRFDITYSEDANGNKIVDPVQVKNLRISFSATDGFNVGDKFNIMPKDGLYWVEGSRGPENITPQIGFDGADNKNRITGGKLTAYYNVRDDNCGRYIDELDALASSLIWEVNRLHSQGAGLAKLTYAEGQQRALDTTKPLGTAQAMLPNSERLQAGNVNFHFYDSVTLAYLDSSMLDFGVHANFDPSRHSLEDVQAAINNITITTSDGSIINPLRATIQDGKLLIESEPESGVEFAMGADSSGLMAALGINTFFNGYDASTLAVNTQVHSNVQLIAAGQVNGDFEINTGDNATAKTIAELINKPVTISTTWKTVTNQTLNQYYANLVTTVGADRRTTKTNTEYHGALSDNLFEQVSSVTGVNMDEEMTHLIKFQHSYTAAAKLITTADEMLQTLLSIKQ